MHSSGEIREFQTAEEAKKAGFRDQLTYKQAAILQTMNREERRIFARKKGWINPEEHNNRVRNEKEARESAKRKRKATHRMKVRARALARA